MALVAVVVMVALMLTVTVAAAYRHHSRLTRASGGYKRDQPTTNPGPAKEKEELGHHQNSDIALNDTQQNQRTPRREQLYRIPPVEPLNDFNWQDVEPERIRPFKPKYHITMGACTPPGHPSSPPPQVPTALKSCPPTDTPWHPN